MKLFKFKKRPKKIQSPIEQEIEHLKELINKATDTHEREFLIHCLEQTLLNNQGVPKS